MVKSALVRAFGMAAGMALIVVMDDPSKYESVKSRSFTCNKTVLLLKEKRSAPYLDSDTSKKVPAVKCVTSSLLFYTGEVAGLLACLKEVQPSSHKARFCSDTC